MQEEPRIDERKLGKEKGKAAIVAVAVIAVAAVLVVAALVLTSSPKASGPQGVQIEGYGAHRSGDVYEITIKLRNPSVDPASGTAVFEIDWYGLDPVTVTQEYMLNGGASKTYHLTTPAPEGNPLLAGTDCYLL